MTDKPEVYPVELLYDVDGVYGVGLSGGYPFNKAPFGEEAENIIRPDLRFRPLILRPDVLVEGGAHRLKYGTGNSTLQMIPPRRLFAGYEPTLEDRFQAVIERGLLHRHGVYVSGGHGPALFEFTAGLSTEARRQFWQKYWGIRRMSRRVTNRLVNRVLEHAADRDALRIARRYHFRYRQALYQQIVLNPRAEQLAEVFPLLAIAVYASPSCWQEHCREEFSGRMAEATALVDTGASLKRVADCMKMPLHLRWIKPGLVYLVQEGTLWEEPNLMHAHLPGTTREARRWLMAIMHAENRQLGPQFTRWVARNAHQFEGRHWHSLKMVVDDLGDFVRASKRNEAHVVRPFHPDMSLKTVQKLSEDWHVAMQSAKGPLYTFPSPWFSGDEVNGYQIVPLESSTELYQEGAIMKNCVGSYGDRVMDGDCYIYSIRQAGERVATLEVMKTEDGHVKIGQLRVTFNKLAPKEIETAAHRWLQERLLGG
jgi:hypothetical protein